MDILGQCLTLHHVSVSFIQGERLNHGLTEVDFFVQRGEWVSLLGKNGSGKSTLGKVLAGLIPMNDGVRSEKLDQGESIQFILQNPDAQIIGDTVYEDLVFSALFAAMLVVMSLLNIQLGFSPVPISLENFVIMLAGGILGATYGFFSIFTVIFLTALGMPLLHGQGGLALIFGPTGGYIWMYPLSALLIGFFISKIKGKTWRDIILIFLIIEVFGSLLLYVAGVPWLAHKAGFSPQKALLSGCYLYLPGDVIKAVIATIIIIPVRQVFPVSRIIGASQTK